MASPNRSKPRYTIPLRARDRREIRRDRAWAQLVVAVFGLVIGPAVHLFNHRPDHHHAGESDIADPSPLSARSRALRDPVFRHPHPHPHPHPHHEPWPSLEPGGWDLAQPSMRPVDQRAPFEGPHGRGSLAHFASVLLSPFAFVLALIVLVIELTGRLRPSGPLLSLGRRDPRVTRGPPSLSASG